MQSKTNVTVTLHEKNYRCRIDDGKHQFIVDEPVEQGGGDTGASPFTHLLASLGSCTAITIRMYAQRKGWPVEDISILLSYSTEMVGDKKVTVFTRAVTVKGNLSEEQLKRLQHIAGACPVSKMLEGSMQVQTQMVKQPADGVS